MTVAPADILVAVVSLLLGYLVGSLPVSPLVGRAAGVDVHAAGDRNPGAANVWKTAGPGWGLLALAGDLAKGALPVSVAIVTWGWNAGWLAALGATIGSAWPLLGRWRGGRGVATFAGAAAALAPIAGLLGFALAGAVAVGGRVLGRNARVPAIATAVAAYPVLFWLATGDVARLLALMLLYTVTVVRYLTTAAR